MDQLQITPERRKLLDQELRDIQTKCLGYQHTYFNPIDGIRMQYDCVIYNMSAMNERKANNKTYLNRAIYNVTVVSRDPETPVPWAIQEHFERCKPERFFVTDNLYHFPFTIIY